MYVHTVCKYVSIAKPNNAHSEHCRLGDHFPTRVLVLCTLWYVTSAASLPVLHQPGILCPDHPTANQVRVIGHLGRETLPYLVVLIDLQQGKE